MVELRERVTALDTKMKINQLAIDHTRIDQPTSGLSQIDRVRMIECGSLESVFIYANRFTFIGAEALS